MKQAKTKEFVEYQQQVVKNAQHLAKRLQEKGYKVVTGGTDNHIIWVDLRTVGLTGSKADKVLENVSIACNKNTVPGDHNALNPGGIRLGTPALTTRGFKEKEIDQVVEFIDRALKIAIQAKDETTGRLLKDFILTLKQPKFQDEMDKLREEIENYAENFFMPGYEI
jgi:glycine hydroxymethyltransferase